jgi:quercetin dioxygenase-like cupin family protein
MTQRIDNPQTGEHITFLSTARESEGDLLRMDIVMDPGGFVAGEHIHPHQEERFEILAGRVRIRVDGIERDAIAGDVVVVSPGSRHVWWNPADQPARVVADLRPALRTRELREVLSLWTAQGRTRGGMPANPLRLAVLAREYRNEVQGVPAIGGSIGWLVNSMLNALLVVAAAVGRLFGITAIPPSRTQLR